MTKRNKATKRNEVSAQNARKRDKNVRKHYETSRYASKRHKTSQTATKHET